MSRKDSGIRKNLVWRFRHFNQFSVAEWHQIMCLRAEIFVVEQECAYQDPDQKDVSCWHLELAHKQELIGTLRSAPRGICYNESSIGRVCVKQNYRGYGLGRDLMQRGIDFNRRHWIGGIRLSAQAYLTSFYESLGFAEVRGPYQEDGIAHLEMFLAH